MEEQQQRKVLSHPSKEFSGTIVNGQFILDKRSKRRLELINIQRCKEQSNEQETNTVKDQS